MTRKKREKRHLEEQMHIKPDRGPTFVGIRPAVFKDAKHPSRAKRRALDRKEGM